MESLNKDLFPQYANLARIEWASMQRLTFIERWARRRTIGAFEYLHRLERENI